MSTIQMKKIMNMRLVAACILAWSGLAMAGAWDVGSFDSDDALDWVWELSESDDLSLVEEALQSAVQASDYLEAPTGSMAIAAAEVVAALRGNPSSKLPTEVSDWTRAHRLAISDELLKAARTAVANVRNAESSELAQLWSESDDMASLWHAELDNLLERLE